jgi:hypothetical protein
VWTTEKETLWIIQNSGLFGTKAGDVFQVIMIDAAHLGYGDSAQGRFEV